jgi:hypothetical protein
MIRLFKKRKGLKKSSTLQKVGLGIVLSLFLFYVLVPLLSPPLSHYYLNNYLKTHWDLELSNDSHMRFNLFTTHLSIKNFRINKNKKKVFSVKDVAIELDLYRLFNDEFFISKYSIKGLFLLIQQTKKNKYVIAGIDLNDLKKQFSSKPLTKKNEIKKKDFKWIIPYGNISNSHFIAQMGQKKQTFAIKKLEISNSHFSSVDQSIVLHLDSTLNQAPFFLDLKGQLKQFKGILSATLELKKFPLLSINTFLPPSIQSLKGYFSFKASNKIHLKSKSIQIKSHPIMIQGDELFYQDTQRSISQKMFHLALNDLQTSPIKWLNNKLILDSMRLKIKKINLIQKSLKVIQKPLLMTLSTLTSEFKTTTLNHSKKNPLQWSTIGNIQLENGKSYAHQKTHELVQFETLTMNRVVLKKQKHLTVLWKQLRSQKGKFSTLLTQMLEKKKNKPILKKEAPQKPIANVSTLKNKRFKIQSSFIEKPLVGFNDFQINDLHYELKHIRIKQIRLLGLLSHVEIEKDKTIKNITHLRSLFNDNEQKPSSSLNKKEILSDKKNKEPIFYRVDNVEISQSQALTFIDHSVNPHYENTFYLDRFVFRDFDSSKINQMTPFTFKGRNGEYSKIHLTGNIYPFTPKVNLTIEGDLKEFSLPPVSSYAHQLLNINFHSGELDTHLSLRIKDSELKGKTTIKIRGMSLGNKEEYNENIIQAQTALPLNMALNMLKDKHDNVELSIPIKGNIDSPSFSMLGLIQLMTKKAVQSVAMSYLMNTFVPYAGVVSLTLSASNFLMKLHFKDLIYQPRQIIIDEAQKEYLSKFITLMKEKKETQVKVCAIATDSEFISSNTQEQKSALETQFTSISKVKNAEIDQQKTLITMTKIDFLTHIAQKRMNGFKRYVVDKGIDSSRILLCTPKISHDTKAKPAIKISV